MKSADLNISFYLMMAFSFLAFSSSSYAESNTQADNSKQQKGTIEKLLERFVQNGARQLFDGTFVYFFEDKVQTVKVHREKNEKGEVVEVFFPMDSKQKKSTRVLDNQYCSLKNNWQYQFQAMSSSFPFRVNNYYHQLQQYYQFTLSELENVAGIPAVGLFIKSKDPYRYSYELWFEPQTAVLLKYKLLDQKGRAVEQYLFTDITIHDNPDSAPEQHSSAFSDMAKSETIADATFSKPCINQFQGLAVAFEQHFEKDLISSGYEPVSFRKGHINQSARQAYQFQLSDGLSSVSIFIEETEQSAKTINGILKLGPVNVVGETIGRHQVTIIGAVPIITALHFLKAIKVSDIE